MSTKCRAGRPRPRTDPGSARSATRPSATRASRCRRTAAGETPSRPASSVAVCAPCSSRRPVTRSRVRPSSALADGRRTAPRWIPQHECALFPDHRKQGRPNPNATQRCGRPRAPRRRTGHLPWVVPVSPVVVRRVALANAVANGLIVVTGGAVRLTGSGLGCPTWPECTDGSITPPPPSWPARAHRVRQPAADLRLAVVASPPWWSCGGPTRRELRRWAVGSFLGIPAQALLGGVTVLTGLNPGRSPPTSCVDGAGRGRHHALAALARTRGSAGCSCAPDRRAGHRHRRHRRRRPGLRHRRHRVGPAQRRPRCRPHRVRPRAGQPAARRRRLPAHRADRGAAGGPVRHRLPPGRSAVRPATCWSSSWRKASSGTCSTSPGCRSCWCCSTWRAPCSSPAYTARLAWSVRGPRTEADLEPAGRGLRRPPPDPRRRRHHASGCTTTRVKYSAVLPPHRCAPPRGSSATATRTRAHSESQASPHGPGRRTRTVRPARRRRGRC